MNELTDLRKYLRALLKWWWVIAATTILAGVASYWHTSRLPKIYEATVTVIVGQSFDVVDPSSTDLDTSGRLAYTYSLIIRRQPIMQGVVDELELDMSWRELRSLVQVYVIPNTQLIEITTQGTSQAQAQAIADEVANQLILQSPTLSRVEDSESETRKFVNQRIKRLQQKIEEGQAEIDELEVTMINAGNQSEKRALRNEIENLEALVSSWENNYSRFLAYVENEESSNVIGIIEPAQAKSNPISPNLQMNLLLAVALGAVLGLLIVFILDNVDDSLKSEEELEQELGLVPLGMVNLMRGKTEADKLISSQNPFSQASEAYRIIRSNLQFVTVGKPRKTMMVTSPGQAEGKSITAANLGIVMAQAGINTILVDADLRQPKQHEIFGLANHAGLTALLKSSKDEIEYMIGDLLKPTSFQELKVLNSGALPPNPAELLDSEQLQMILDELSTMADIVILDGMPILPVADSVILSNKVDGVILIADAGRTRRADLRKALKKLSKANAKVWGVVLNRAQIKASYYRRKGFSSQEAPAQLDNPPAATD